MKIQSSFYIYKYAGPPQGSRPPPPKGSGPPPPKGSRSSPPKGSRPPPREDKRQKGKFIYKTR